MRTILITGVNGFVGKHLAKELKSQNHRVIGTGTDSKIDPSIIDCVDAYIGKCDLTDKDAVSSLPLGDVDAVINLAGLASIGASFKNSAGYLLTNVKVHTVLLERAIARKLTGTRFLSISTGAIYDPHQPMPISESGLLANAGSPYAQSKIAMEKELADYRNKGLDVVIARPFNHIGPGQLPGFLLPDLIDQVLNRSEVVVGDLSTRRDYTDVRDVVKAYVFLATAPELDTNLCNICSGKSISGQEMLDLIFELSGRPKKPVRIGESLLRPNDPTEIYGDNSLLRKMSGWQPEIPLKKTIADCLKAP